MSRGAGHHHPCLIHSNHSGGRKRELQCMLDLFSKRPPHYTMLVLPFDAHNHIHMGPSPPLQALIDPTGTTLSPSSSMQPIGSLMTPITITLSGMAIMSTHPRDFDVVLRLSKDLPQTIQQQRDQQTQENIHIIPCFGVHPWFLHELTTDDWSIDPALDDSSSTHRSSLSLSSHFPKWLQHVQDYCTNTPHSIVGEIGLDGFHFDPVSQELVSPMDRQVEAFVLQMKLAHQLQKPVSIHTVQCFGPLLETLSLLKKQRQLPPKLYFHAFGGKVGTIQQLLAICEIVPSQRVYFGFAAVINFRSPKTADVIRKVGLERILLESDHDDAALVYDSMRQGVQFIAQALQVSEEHVIARTTQNAMDFYDIACVESIM